MELNVQGVGVATTDAELRHVGEKKTAVCSVNLAFNRSYKKSQGDSEWQKETCFLKVQIWGARAERMGELVKKGQPIYVSGFLKQDTWNDKDSGQKRISYSANLRDFQLCMKNGKKSETSEVVTTKVAATASTEPSNDDNGNDNDIPF